LSRILREKQFGIEMSRIQGLPGGKRIKSHYSQPASTSSSLPSAGGAVLPDFSSQAVQYGLQRPTFQNLESHHMRVGALAWSSLLSSGSHDKSILHHDICAQEDYVSRLTWHKSEAAALTNPTSCSPHVVAQHLPRLKAELVDVALVMRLCMLVSSVVVVGRLLLVVYWCMSALVPTPNSRPCRPCRWLVRCPPSAWNEVKARLQLEMVKKGKKLGKERNIMESAEVSREELLDVLCKDHSFDIYRFQFHRLWFSPLFDPLKSCLFFYLVGVEDSTELLG
ncbi:hypothetical protein ACJX0J_037906, partial [Zea mays]